MRQQDYNRAEELSRRAIEFIPRTGSDPPITAITRPHPRRKFAISMPLRRGESLWLQPKEIRGNGHLEKNWKVGG